MPRGLKIDCQRCGERHWPFQKCDEAEVAREAERLATPTPIYRPREGFHSPGFGSADPSSFSTLKRRKVS